MSSVKNSIYFYVEQQNEEKIKESEENYSNEINE